MEPASVAGVILDSSIIIAAERRGQPVLQILEGVRASQGDNFESAPMGNTWIVDMRHYLDEETGDLPESLPTPVLNLALFFGSIVGWVTDHLPEGDWHTNVSCRRSPGRKRCLGMIFADLDRVSGHIVWRCSVCGDNGLIHGWEDTFWNRQGGAAGAHACSSDTPPTMSH